MVYVFILSDMIHICYFVKNENSIRIKHYQNRNLLIKIDYQQYDKAVKIRQRQFQRFFNNTMYYCKKHCITNGIISQRYYKIN